MKNQTRDYLLNFARGKLDFYSDDLPSLAEMVKAENKKQIKPISDADCYLVMQDAVKYGAIKAPIICSSAGDVNLEDACMPVYYIASLLSDGVTFLNSPPKGGKSRLFMQMALALCNGSIFMGRSCKKVSVLYLALEDERKDFESRLKLFLNGDDAPENLFFATLEDFDYIPPTLENNELIDLINENIKEHPDIKVVLIDVFGVIRSKKQRGEDFMDVERRDVQSLIKLSAENRNISVVVAHHVSHTKRRGQIETIGSGAGSYVISATVHAEMLLYRNEQNKTYTFSVQGRRLPLQKFIVEDDFPRFRFCGSNDEYEASNNPLIITIKHIVENNKEDKAWCGFGSDITAYAEKNGLPAIKEKINKNTFSNQFIHVLSIAGVRYQQIKNGKGAVKHQFSKL